MHLWISLPRTPSLTTTADLSTPNVSPMSSVQSVTYVPTCSDLAEPPEVTSCAVPLGARARASVHEKTLFNSPAVCSPTGGVQGAGPLGRKTAVFRLPNLLLRAPQLATSKSSTTSSSSSDAFEAEDGAFDDRAGDGFAFYEAVGLAKAGWLPAVDSGFAQRLGGDVPGELQAVRTPADRPRQQVHDHFTAFDLVA